MAKIQLTPQELLAQSTEMASLQKEYEALFGTTSSILTRVNGNWSEALSRNFLGKMNSAQKGCKQLIASLETGSKLAKTSAQTYQSMDEQLAKYFGGGDANLSPKQYVDKMQQTISNAVGKKKSDSGSKKKTTKKKEKKKNWWDKLCDGAADLYEDVSTGVAKVVDVVEDGVESALDFAGDVIDKGVDLAQDGIEWVGDKIEDGLVAAADAVDAAIDSYQEKGLVYKIVKTGGAVVSTIGACTSIVASWGAAIGSGGLATGLAAVSTAYGANTIVNSFADIYNCWAGDVEEVGKVNVLKDKAKEIGGAIGGALGNEELGENIGAAVYTAGGLVSIVNNISVLKDKVIQLDDYGMTLKEGASQLKQGWNGVVDIVTHSSLGNVKLDLALLSQQVPELMEAIGVVKVGGEILGTGWNLGTTVGKVIQEAIGAEGGGSLFQALGWNDAETVMNVVDTGNDIVDMFTEGFGKLSDAWDVYDA
ncbi:MAG: WXG100 family type VII secretion target [Lachnospiraceae bacterium]|nr:WXG100 family type VII secretion target [Lachnospiraceae bacterium]